VIIFLFFIFLAELESDDDSQQTEIHAVQVEEVGLAISSASRLLTKLLDLELFRHNINPSLFTKLLRKILKSNIPLQYKDWTAACLVKLGSLYGPTPILEFENPINMEVTLYEKIPRLIDQMRSSFSLEAQETAVLELNRIISEGMVDATRAVASDGGIFPLVKLIEGGSERAVEAAICILYNLSMDNENHAAILAAGAVPALRRIILSERSQWKRALRLLRNLPTWLGKILKSVVTWRQVPRVVWMYTWMLIKFYPFRESPNEIYESTKIRFLKRLAGPWWFYAFIRSTAVSWLPYTPIFKCLSTRCHSWSAIILQLTFT